MDRKCMLSWEEEEEERVPKNNVAKVKHRIKLNHLKHEKDKQLSWGQMQIFLFWHTPNNHDAALLENNKMWLAPWRSWREQKILSF